MSELERLDYLFRFPDPSRYAADGILERYPLYRRIEEVSDELESLLRQRRSLRTSRVPVEAGGAEVSTGRKRYHQIPSVREMLAHIPADMRSRDFRLEDVAGNRIMSESEKRISHSPENFTGDEYAHLIVAVVVRANVGPRYAKQLRHVVSRVRSVEHSCLPNEFRGLCALLVHRSSDSSRYAKTIRANAVIRSGRYNLENRVRPILADILERLSAKRISMLQPPRDEYHIVNDV
jgi:hypothetical protein